MSSIPATPSHEPEYAWEIATLYPAQGEWSEEEYLQLTDHANRRIEYTAGRLEFLPMPTYIHETLVRFLFRALDRYVDQRKLGEVFSNGIRLRVAAQKYRLPDVIFLHRDHLFARHNRAWEAADVVMEVVSDSPASRSLFFGGFAGRDADRQRDYEQKLIDYAAAKVAEYWIVDRERQVVIVHGLVGGDYSMLGEYTRGQIAASGLLAGFEIDVAALFAAAENIPE
jgi:Uma2 family endonuclease